MTDSSQSLRASVWEWCQTGLIVVSFAWTTLNLGGYRPETMAATSALNVTLLIVHLCSRLFGEGGAQRLHPAGLCMLPFIVYAAANVLWVTPVPWLGWQDWLGWAQMGLIFWVVLNGIRSNAPRTLILGTLVAVALIAVALGCYQRFVNPSWMMMGRTQAAQFIGRASGSFGLPNSLAALLLLLIPLLVAMTLRQGAAMLVRLFSGVVAAAFLLGLLLTISRGACLALALVFTIWPVSSAGGSWLRRCRLAGVATLGVALAFATVFYSLPDVRERFVRMKVEAGERTRPFMWRGAWRIFRESPVLGGGAGSFNVRFEKFRPEGYQDQPMWAHNDYLNTLSDYGVVGLVLSFGAAGFVAWRVWRSRRTAEWGWLDFPGLSGALGAGMAAFCVQLLVEFHFKIPALAMAFGILAALLVQREWPIECSRVKHSTVASAGYLVFIVALFISLTYYILPFYKAEALRYSGREAIDRIATQKASPSENRRTLEHVQADLADAVKISPINGQAWSDLSYVTALLAPPISGELVERGKVAEDAAKKALKISGIVPEFWDRLGVSLDMQGRGDEAGEAFVHALNLAPETASVWFYQAYHLSLGQTDPALAQAAVEFCLRLDPGNADAQSLRQRLAITRRPP